jgi:ATP-dependent Clp endopeptidase proteolytic subunit ClpP
MKQRFTSLQPTADLPKLQAILSARQPEEGEKGRGWYTITNVSQSEAEVFIYDEIGMWGVTAGDFVNELREIKASNITLRINSPGGDVFDGIAIYNAVKRHKAEVAVFVDGIAASAASFIAMAGDTVTMMPHSQMMIHEAHGLVIGPADDMRKMADILDKSSDNIASIYAERAGGTTEEWRGRMRDETWISDQEAVDLGLADSIEGEDEEAIAARVAAQVEAEVEIVNEEPETEVDSPPVDFLKQFEDIADEAEEAQYAVAGGE